MGSIDVPSTSLVTVIRNNHINPGDFVQVSFKWQTWFIGERDLSADVLPDGSVSVATDRLKVNQKVRAPWGPGHDWPWPGDIPNRRVTENGVPIFSTQGCMVLYLLPGGYEERKFAVDFFVTPGDVMYYPVTGQRVPEPNSLLALGPNCAKYKNGDTCKNNRGTINIEFDIRPDPRK